jgi:hypothetical protein
VTAPTGWDPPFLMTRILRNSRRNLASLHYNMSTFVNKTIRDYTVSYLYCQVALTVDRQLPNQIERSFDIQHTLAMFVSTDWLLFGL